MTSLCFILDHSLYKRKRLPSLTLYSFFIYLFIYLNIYLFKYLFIYLSIYLLIYLLYHCSSLSFFFFIFFFFFFFSSFLLPFLLLFSPLLHDNALKSHFSTFPYTSPFFSFLLLSPHFFYLLQEVLDEANSRYCGKCKMHKRARKVVAKKLIN